MLKNDTFITYFRDIPTLATAEQSRTKQTRILSLSQQMKSRVAENDIKYDKTLTF